MLEYPACEEVMELASHGLVCVHNVDYPKWGVFFGGDGFVEWRSWTWVGRSPSKRAPRTYLLAVEPQPYGERYTQHDGQTGQQRVATAVP